MTSTQKGGGGVLQFVTCLRILLFLNIDLLLFLRMVGVGGSKNWSFFVDVIKGWPLLFLDNNADEEFE